MLGLKDCGGNFEIEESMQEKIVPVGFMPSYQKPPLSDRKKIRQFYQLNKREKLVFSYVSGFGAGYRIWVLKNLICAVDTLLKHGAHIRVIHIGPQQEMDCTLQRDWLIYRNGLSAEEYYATLAASDLVFQHQGMVTLSQAISARIPVIANVSYLHDEGMPKIHFWEVGPFARAGVCSMLSKSSHQNIIRHTIEQLLFDKQARKRMQKNQTRVYEMGEKNAYNILEALRKKKLCEN